MKDLFKFSFLFVCALYLCSCKSVSPTAGVICLSERDGMITVKSIGYGKSQKKSHEIAEKNLFDVLFFRGLPGSSQKQPLIGINEQELKRQHKDYFNQFYNRKYYMTFLSGSEPTNKKIKKGLEVEIKVHFRALRSELESQGIIRKFGY